MKVVVAGVGKVGHAIIQQLAMENHDITAIDCSADALEYVQNTADILTIKGNGASVETLTEAGAGRADMFIAVMADDETNLLACVVAKRLGCRHTLARVRSPEHSRNIRFFNDQLGISMIFNPEFAAAREIFRMLQFPSFLKRDSFAAGLVELVEIHVKDGSPLCGVTLSNFQSIAQVRSLVCTVERDGEAIIPSGSFQIKEGDNITVTAGRRDFNKLIKNLGIAAPRVRNVMIIGGGTISRYLAMRLIEAGMSVKIIELDHERCLKLSEFLPEAMIIEGDGTMQDLLIEEGISSTDAVVALTGIDEENLLVSMYAKHIGVPKTITKINRIEYKDVLRASGIESLISPKMISTTEIVRYARDMGHSRADSVITLRRIAGGNVEALEFIATEETRHLGELLINIKLKKNTLVACIHRGNQIIIPTGSDSIHIGDTVVTISRTSDAVTNLNDIFND